MLLKTTYLKILPVIRFKDPIKQKAGRSNRMRRRSQKVSMIYFCVRYKKEERSYMRRRRSQQIWMSYFCVRRQKACRKEQQDEEKEPEG